MKNPNLLAIFLEYRNIKGMGCYCTPSKNRMNVHKCCNNWKWNYAGYKCYRGTGKCLNFGYYFSVLKSVNSGTYKILNSCLLIIPLATCMQACFLPLYNSLYIYIDKYILNP